MKNKRKIAVLALLALALFLPGRAVAAGSSMFGEAFDGKIIVGQSFTLKSGETLSGDLAVLGGSAFIEQGARVEGSIAIVGGSLQLDGEVHGDVAIIGGLANLGATAYVSGNVAVVGGSLTRAEGARVAGNVLGAIMSGAAWDNRGTIPPTGPVPPVHPEVPTRPSILRYLPRIYFDMWNGVPEAFAQAAGLALFAMLLMLFLARPAERVAQAIVSSPILTGSIGLLSILVMPLLMVIMAMTILLIPAIPFVALILAAALLFGWTALGYEIGQRTVRALKGSWHPSFAAGLGTFLLTIGASALTHIPVLQCIGWLFPTLLACAALGSVVVTIFGTRSYPTAGQPPAATPPPPEIPAP